MGTCIGLICGFICLPVNYTCFNRHTQKQNSSSAFSTDYNMIVAGEMQALFPNVYTVSMAKRLDASSNAMSCSLGNICYCC